LKPAIGRWAPKRDGQSQWRNRLPHVRRSAGFVFGKQIKAKAKHARSTEEEPMNRRRCEHTTYPVEVLSLDGGKKIAYCLGCGRTGPVCKSSSEAVIALREIPRLAFQQRRRSLR
jgi:hypothetical protein